MITKDVVKKIEYLLKKYKVKAGKTLSDIEFTDEKDASIYEYIIKNSNDIKD